MAFQDEAAVCLCPSLKSTYAIKGKTPVLIVADTKKYQHLSVSAIICENGEMFFECREGNFNGPAIVRHLKKRLKGKRRYTLIWDNASIHKCQAVKDYLKENEKKQTVWLENIPPYSPELNPTELLWAYLKGTALAGIVCKTLSELKTVVIEKMEEIKKDTALIASFFKCQKTGFMQS